MVLRHINLHVYKQNFECGNLRTIKNTFAKDFFVLSFDFKSVYYHVDIFPDHRIYLAFSWEFIPGHTRFLQSTVLPLGFPVLKRHIMFSMIESALAHCSKLLS